MLVGCMMESNFNSKSNYFFCKKNISLFEIKKSHRSGTKDFGSLVDVLKCVRHLYYDS
jgi:hypothetical protein